MGIKEWLARPRNEAREVQVAFYGGSFTGLDRSRQHELLSAVQPFLEHGEVDTVRLSTRPDYIDSDRAFFLKERGVGIVELGIQSFDRKILEKCRRGHSADDVEKAFACLRRADLSVGGQLMVGLPGETTCKVLNGAHRLADLQPDMVRIYPTLVLRGSPLAHLFDTGEYIALSLGKAVSLCCRLQNIFAHKNIPVVRMGLQPSESLERDLIAGPYHPAFGELVLSRLFFKKMRSLLTSLQKQRSTGTIKLYLSSRDQSILQGQKKCSANRLKFLGLFNGVDSVFQQRQPRGTIKHEIIP